MSLPLTSRSVLDVNVVIGMVYPLPIGKSAIALYTSLEAQSEHQFYAPHLWRYEAVSVVRKLIAHEAISHEEGLLLVNRLFSLPILCTEPAGLWELALVWAERVRHAKAYDAAYLAYSELIGARFYTADERLYNAALQNNAMFVSLVR